MPLVDDDMAAALAALGENCVIAVQDNRNRWRRDHGAISEEGLPLLVAAYTSLLEPGVDAAVEAALTRSGIDLAALLTAPVGGREDITRSDACELAALSTLHAHDRWPLELLHMPNIPKGSRRQSESGIDIMTASIEVDGPADLLLETEVVYLASVKHTITERNDRLVGDLVKSVTTSLTPEYLTCQLRVLDHVVHSRLPTATRGRVFLVLRDFPRDSHVRISAVAAVDLAQMDNAVAATDELPTVPPDVYQYRVIAIHHLADLHKLCP